MSELPFEFDVDICPPPVAKRPVLDEDTNYQVDKLRAVLVETSGQRITPLSTAGMRELSPYFSCMALICHYGVFYDDRLHADPEQLIYTLAHEVGHAIDFSKNRVAKLLLEVSCAAWGANYTRWPLPNRRAVYETEVRAWDNADMLVNRLNLRIDPARQWSERTMALAAYLDILNLQTEVRFDIKLEY